MAWETPKIDWSSLTSEGVQGDDFNRIEGNTLYLYNQINPEKTALNKDFAGNGTADTVNHSDHTHAADDATGQNSAYNQTFSSNGSSNLVSRDDHTTEAEDITGGNTAFNRNFDANGVSVSVSRSDHSHTGSLNVYFTFANVPYSAGFFTLGTSEGLPDFVIIKITSGAHIGKTITHNYFEPTTGIQFQIEPSGVTLAGGDTATITLLRYTT